MLFRKTVLALATCSLALTACSNKKNREVVKTIDTKAITADESLSKKDKSEKLALAAEQLVSPGSFMYAQVVLEQSLSIDKDNKRAQLVEAIIAPLMATQGLMARIQPLSEKTEEAKAKYDNAVKKLEEKPTHALKNFLFDGKADIKNENDVQGFLDSVRAAYDKQRLFFKNNKDLDMTFNIADIFSAAALSKEDACYWVETEQGYEELCVEDQEPVVLQFKLNRADNETLQQIASGLQIYFTLYNSYNLSGVIDTAIANKDETDTNLIREELLKNSSFGTLRSNAALNSIKSLGLDAISGVRWASQLQDELCAAGTQDKSNRPGYVISKGMCIPQRPQDKEPLSDILATAELLLNGSTIEKTFYGAVSKHTTIIKPSSVAYGSVKDVRDLELQFNECGKVIGAGDTTLGGTFPRKDANIVINLGNLKCEDSL